jgi:hypothetical protein
MAEQSQNTAQKFGSIEVPQDWKIDPGGEYAQTTKEKALEFFDERDWSPTFLQQAVIDLRNGKKNIYFVTGGFGSYFWDMAKNVTVQEIKSSEQIERDFSRDVPEGKFFIKKVKLSK